MTDSSNSKIVVKSDNITIVPTFDVDCNDEYNRRYEENVIISRCQTCAKVCPCQYSRMRSRERLKNRVPGSANVPIRVEQEDVDTIKFAVIASGESRRYSKIDMVVAQCSQCGKLQFYGDLLPVANYLADGYEAFAAAFKSSGDGNITAVTSDVGGSGGSGLVFENIKTGEITSAENAFRGISVKGKIEKTEADRPG